MTDTQPRSECPISNALEIWGDKWSLLIIRDLMYFNKNTYGDFLQSEEKISTNILASRLVALEKNEIIQKCAHPKSKAKVWYQLCPKGIALLPMMLEISLWAQQFSQVPDNVAQMLQIVQHNKAEFIQQKTQQLMSLYQTHHP